MNSFKNLRKFKPVVSLFVFIMLLSAAGPLVRAAASQTKAVNDRPKIGLALSGGGARGAAHIGVIRMLEELRIPIDYIAGTSMGSIVGGLYASGMSTNELEELLTNFDWKDAFHDLIPRRDRSFRRKTDDNIYLVKKKPGITDKGEIKLPPGLLQGQKIDLIFKRATLPVAHIKNFDDLSIPFRVVASDISNGKAAVLGSGDLALSMRASMSVPAIFSAVEIDGRLLVDGGISNNLPVSVVREMGADIIIAIDVSTPLRTRDEINSAIDVTAQLAGLLTRRNTEAQIANLSDRDILIIPDLGDIKSGSFDRAAEAIPIGYAAADMKRQELARLSMLKNQYTGHLAARKKRVEKKLIINFVRLNNQSRISDDVLLSRLDIKEDEPLDVDKLEKNIGTIYGLELFENVRYDVVEENGKTGLVVHAKERSWGPNYLQGGVAISDNLDGDNNFNLGLAYTRTAINQLGGEWRTALQIGESPLIATEFYQPLDVNSRFFIHPVLLYGKNNVRVFDKNGNLEADYQLTRYGIDLGFGREFGTWGQARLGIRRIAGEADLQVGKADIPEFSYDKGEWYARLSVDKLNNRNFPQNGVVGKLEYIVSSKDLNADMNFDQILFDALAAKTWGKNTFLAGTRFFTTPDDDAPVQNRFVTGGLFNLSGFNIDELSGQHLGLLRLGYMRRINDFNLLPMYLGASLELGNVWEFSEDIDFDNTILAGSLFLGVDTFLGPVYVGYGVAEHNNQSFYLFVGKLF